MPHISPRDPRTPKPALMPSTPLPWASARPLMSSRGHGCHRQLERFGPHDFETGAPNVTAGPICPKDRGTWQETWELGESVFRLEKGCRGNHLIGRDAPENGTDPSWFGGGRAFL